MENYGKDQRGINIKTYISYLNQDPFKTDPNCDLTNFDDKITKFISLTFCL